MFLTAAISKNPLLSMDTMPTRADAFHARIFTTQPIE
jgi:hypothetical protein